MDNINLTQNLPYYKVRKAYEKGFIVIPSRPNEDGIFKIPIWNGNIKNQKWDFETFKEAVKTYKKWSFGVLTGKQPNGLYLNCLDFDIDNSKQGFSVPIQDLAKFFLSIKKPEALHGVEQTQTGRFHFFFLTKEPLIGMKAKKEGWIKLKEGEERQGEIELFTNNKFVACYEGIVKDTDKEPIPLRDLPVLEVSEVKQLLKKLGFEFDYITEDERIIKEIQEQEEEKTASENQKLEKIKQLIKKKVRIEEILKDYSKYFQVMNDTGSRIDCLCPFKPERNSSFKIFNTEKSQFWVDFHGKHEGFTYPETCKIRNIGNSDAIVGDVFDIYQIFTGATFKQALKDLGERAGIPKKEIEKALNDKGEENKKKEINILEKIKNKKEAIKKEIEEIKPVEFLLNLPIVIAEEQATINMILADAGKGKSLFHRSIIGSLIDKEDYIFLYFDLEYIAQISKERKFNELLERDNFYLITPEEIEELKEDLDIKQTSLIVYEIINEFIKSHQDKKIIAFIDSFEDLIEDTSDDKTLKRTFQKLLLLRRTTFIIAHHIAKDIAKTNAMRFRGSMVIKAKMSSMLYITGRTTEDDFTSLFEIEILKIRAMYKPVKKLTVRVNLQEFKVLDVITETDNEELYILKQVFFTLKKAGQMRKTKLIEEVSKKARKHKDKVRAVIERNEDMFEIEKGDKRTVYYRITTNKFKLDKYMAMLGIGDSSLSEIKQELLEVLSNIDDNESLNLEIKKGDGGLIVYQKTKTIKNDIYNMPDETATEILNALQKLMAYEVSKIEETEEETEDVPF